MNRQQLRERVRFLTLVESHEVSDAELDALLDEGYHNVLTAAKWPWTLETLAFHAGSGQWSHELDIDPELTSIVGVYHEDTGDNLRSMSYEQAMRLNDGRRREGRPEVFTFSRRDGKAVLTLFPVPLIDEEIGVAYRGSKVFTDTPPWHVAFHEVLVDWAAFRVWEHEEDFERSAQYRGRFDLRLLEMQEFYDDQTEDRPRIFGEFQRSY